MELYGQPWNRKPVFMHNDQELIQACLRNERNMQRTLYERFSPQMLVVCMRYSKGRAEAEDILQDAFIKVFANLKNFRQECPLESWIRRIVVNTALKHNRSKLFLYPAADIETLEETTTDEVDLSALGLQELIGMIQQLAPRYQMVFNLYAIEGYKHREIAQMLDITEGTSKSQYAKARVLLQEMIDYNYRVNYASQQ